MQKSIAKILIAISFSFLLTNIEAQNSLSDDISLIKQNKIQATEHSKATRPFIYSNETSPVIRYNPVNLVFGGMLFVYQNLLSQQFSATCLYNPSCSEFSKQSIEEYGLLKGLFLSADRLTRCNRIAATGIHPIRVENNKVVDPVEFYRLK
jgi:putative membrane protein insertion efficiency factor